MKREALLRARPALGLAEYMGRLAGAVVGPLFALGSRARGARLFHPDGHLFEAAVRPAVIKGPFAVLAARLRGHALVRVSGGWWKGGKEWPDLLGVAIRFGGPHRPHAEPRVTDQDLLFATARSLQRIPFALLTTNQHDFLANHYYAAAPFQVDGVGLVDLRLVPDVVRFTGNRQQRLERAMHEGLAVLRMEGRVEGQDTWEPIVDVELVQRAKVPQEETSFYPFNCGMGLQPRGFAHELRRATYPMSHPMRAPNHQAPQVRP